MRIAPVVGFVGFASAAALIALACDDDPHRRTAPGQSLGGGGACQAKAGELPPPNCDDSSNECESAPGCAIDEARCGSTATCLPIADNEGKDVVDLRLRRLNITAPEALASTLIQNTVVNAGIDLDAPSCAEKGKGLFSWLMRVDKKAGTLVTGGAPPSSDPIGKGFCFANFTFGSTKVEPLTANIAFSGNTFKTIEKADVNIPIFVTDQLSSAIILPITSARIEGVTISDDGNCVGAFNASALKGAACTEDRTQCQKWTTAGALGGYITLEAADRVEVELLHKSLCAFFSGESERCARDESGKIVYEGDYCSTDESPGGCKDSMWLAATFAASAVKIFDGAGSVEGCSGATTGPVDAGTDAKATDPGDAGDAGL